jgi:hypothetical protein
MVVDRRPQTLLATDGGIGNGSNAILLQPQHDFDIETLQGGLVETWRMIAKANDVDGRPCDTFEKRFGGNQSVEVMSLGDILVNEPPEFICRAP